MFLGNTLTCPVIYENYWACPDGRKLHIPTILMSDHHVNQSHLVKIIENACIQSMPSFCQRKNQSILEVFRLGDCSGGFAGDMADIPFLAAW